MFAQGQSHTAPPSAASPHACNAVAGDGDEARWRGGGSRRTQANTDLQWKALGSRSRPPGRGDGVSSECTANVPAFGVCPVHGCQGKGRSSWRLGVQSGGELEGCEAR